MVRRGGPFAWCWRLTATSLLVAVPSGPGAGTAVGLGLGSKAMGPLRGLWRRSAATPRAGQGLAKLMELSPHSKTRMLL